MSPRLRDGRATEYTKWAASRPGTPGDRSQRRSFRNPLQRPVLTMFGILAFVVVVGGGAYAMFGAGEPTVSAEHAAIVDSHKLEGTICCIEHQEIDGAHYLFTVVLEPPGFFSERSTDVTLRILSLSNGVMEQIASLDAPIKSHLPRGMTVADTTAYVPLGISDDEEHGIWMVDVSNPESPEAKGIHAGETYYRNVASGLGDNLVAHSAMGFSVYEHDNAGELLETSRVERPEAEARNIEIINGLLAYHTDQISFWNLSDPGLPEPFGRHGNPRSRDIVSGRVTSAEEFLDLRAPANRLHDFVMSGNYMYVAASDDGLEIVDVSDPESPNTLDHIQLDGRAVRTAIADDLLYVVTVDEESRERLAYEVQQFDLSDAVDPAPIRTIDDIRAAPGRQAIETGGGYVFLGLNNTVVMIDGDAN